MNYSLTLILIGVVFVGLTFGIESGAVALVLWAVVFQDDISEPIQ